MCASQLASESSGNICSKRRGNSGAKTSETSRNCLKHLFGGLFAGSVHFLEKNYAFFRRNVREKPSSLQVRNWQVFSIKRA